MNTESAPQRAVQRQQKRRRRRSAYALISAHLVAVGAIAYLLYYDRVQALARERTLQSTWQSDEQRGLSAKDIQVMSQRLASDGGPGRLLFAPWDGYDATITQLDKQTKQEWQSDLTVTRQQAQDALTAYNKTQAQWGKTPDALDQQKLEAASTPAAYEQLAKTWTQENRAWQDQVTQLQQLGGGFVNGRPADIVKAEQRLQTDVDKGGLQSNLLAKVQHAIQDTKSYFTLTPAEEVQEHANQMQELKDAIAAVPIIINPFDATFLSYVNTRQSEVSAAVYDAVNGRTYTYQPNLKFGTASIIKATIMADLLYQSQKSDTPLTSTEQQEMVPMIENSDNDAASALWDTAGAASGIAGFLKAVGMNDTVPGTNDYWGLTTTTAPDQVALMKLYAYPNAILDNASRQYGLNLMEHITPFEDWGVSAGPTEGTTIALKNGWSPAKTDDWRINSIGYVQGDGRNYVVAILSQNNPSEQYGIDTVQAVSRDIWNALGEGDTK